MPLAAQQLRTDQVMSYSPACAHEFLLIRGVRYPFPSALILFVELIALEALEVELIAAVRATMAALRTAHSERCRELIVALVRWECVMVAVC